MTEGFKTKSGANSTGLYNNYPLKRDNQTKNLYKEFHPVKNEDKSLKPIPNYE